MKYARKRDQAEAAIVTALVAAGCHVARLDGSGIPDLVVSKPNGDLMLIEIKDPLKTTTHRKTIGKHGPLAELTPAQVKFWSRWEPKPAIVHSVAEALEAVGV